MRCRLSVCMVLYCLLASHAIAAAQDAPVEIPEQVVLEVMRNVLAGNLPAALGQAQQLQHDHPVALARQLVREVTDLSQGNYATTGNQSFASLRPYWSTARERWLEGIRPEVVGLPGNVVQLPEQTAQVLLVDVSRSAAWLMQRGPTDWQIADAFYVSAGAAGADKWRRGDKRTPIGVYWPVDELDPGDLPARYGARVFPLDYPNALDRRQRRSGDGIWLHGIDPDNNIRPPRDTDGCIAFDNNRIEALAARLELGATPVVVAQSLDWQTPQASDAVGPELQMALMRWRSAFLAADTQDYFALHAADFTRFGQPTSGWRAATIAAMRSGIARSMILAELQVFVADSDEGIYLTRFRQTLNRKNAKPITTMRRLYWQRIDGGWQIIADQNG